MLPLGSAATPEPRAAVAQAADQGCLASATHSNASKLPGHGLRTLLALSLLSLAACNVGPDFQRPRATQVQAWSLPAPGAASRAVDSPMQERWWEVFNDPQLSALSRRR